MPEPYILHDLVTFWKPKPCISQCFFLCFDKAKTMYFTVFCSFVKAKTMYFIMFSGFDNARIHTFYKTLWSLESQNHVFPNIFFGFDKAKTMRFT